jgi:DNA polymerase III subunit chi
MPDVGFHSGVADKLGYTCRLLRKAYRQRARVVVTGDAEQLARLDQALWLFEQQEFVPHARLRRGDSPAPRLARTPIWLIDPGAPAPHHEVLVNLGPDLADGFDAYRRVIEIVSLDEADRRAGKQRWRAYEARGMAITHHPQGAAA